MKKLAVGLLIILSISPIARAQNIILNSSYELWLDSLGIRIPFGWYTSEPTDSGTAVRIADPHTGIYALQLNGSDTSAYAITLSICFTSHHYNFSGWCKSNSIIAGSFIITWLSLSQQLVGNPVIIPIYRSTSWHQYTQMVQAPDSAVLVNINIVTLPHIAITVDDVTLTDTTITAVEQENRHEVFGSTLTVYPNPAKTFFNIGLPLSANRSSLKIFDVTGKLIKEFNSLSAEENKISLIGVSPGIYFMELKSENRNIVQKLIVQR
jgi:hypothetical protein